MLSLCKSIAREGEIRVPVVNKVEQEIKELIGYYKFTTKQRVQASNHLESIQIKDGSVYAIKDLEKEIKNFRLKEKALIVKIKETLSLTTTRKPLSFKYKNRF